MSIFLILTNYTQLSKLLLLNFHAIYYIHMYVRMYVLRYINVPSKVVCEYVDVHV